MKNNENGRSMVEMLGVLAIIGVLSAGGLAGYSKAMFKHKLNSTMEQITMLVTNIRTMYGTQGNYDGLSNANAVELGAVPAIMGSGSALTSPFKGDVYIQTALTSAATVGDSITGHATAFLVTYENLPKEACIALATADFGSGAGSGFIGTAAFPSSSASAPSDADDSAAGRIVADNEGNALSMAEALDACTSEDNAVSWKFY